MGKHTTTKSTNNKTKAGLVGAGVLSTLMLAASFNGTLAAFTASITNSVNGTGMGTLTMQETNADGTITCNSTDGTNNTATCANINKYGGNVAAKPGSSTTTTINIKNTGTIDANSFTLEAGACSQQNAIALGTAKDFCSKVNVNITSGSTTIYNGTASGLTSVSLPVPVKPGQTVPFTFVVSTPDTLDNTYQGVSASQPLTWKFAA